MTDFVCNPNTYSSFERCNRRINQPKLFLYVLKVATKIKMYTFYDEDKEGQFEFSSGRSCLLGFADI
jgi:hypothetical protein